MMKGILASLLLVAAHLISADRIVVEAGETHNSLAPNLSKRQYCPSTYSYCMALNGDALCLAPDEVCCQLITGTDPYTCPIDHPYCCPTESGTLMCGSDESCSGPVINGPGDAVKPTDTTGAAPTATQRAKTAAAAGTKTGSSSQSTTIQNTAGLRSNSGVGQGLVAAILAVGAALV